MLFCFFRKGKQNSTGSAGRRAAGRENVKFTKMQGLGNDYIYVNCLSEDIGDPAALAVRLSDRHFGIGSDGLILIRPSEKADFMMDMYNADGSRGKMCGNGIRCVGKFVYDYGLTTAEHLRIDTLSGVRELELEVKDGKVRRVCVDMGAPEIQAAKVPVLTDQEKLIAHPAKIAGMDVELNAVSMGNPHCVIRVEDPDVLDLEAVGPMFEHHSMFPEGVNTEFVRVIDRTHMKMRVWERGSGETLACGTGACACLAAGVLNGWTEREAQVELRGGILHIRWDECSGRIYMTGPAETVFEGEVEF